MKNIAGKIDEKKAERLAKIFGSNYNAISNITDIFFLQRANIQEELKRIFAKEELTALCDMYNGTMFQPDFAIRELMIAQIEDSELYENTCTRYSINVEDLKEKVSNLSQSVVFWTIFEIWQMWEKGIALDVFIKKYI